jgi:NADH:ubiquinone oxidoreductase subunit 2 (subunit N)
MQQWMEVVEHQLSLLINMVSWLLNKHEGVFHVVKIKGFLSSSKTLLMSCFLMMLSPIGLPRFTCLMSDVNFLVLSFFSLDLLDFLYFFL